MPYEATIVDHQRNWFSGLPVKLRVIVALVGREMITAYGNRKLGYVWALIEPSALILVFLFIRAYVRENIPFGESALLFMFSGIVAFRVFTIVAGRTLNAVIANQALLTFPQVRPLDVIFARVLMQSLTMIAVLIVFYAGMNWIEEGNIIVHVAGFTAGVLLTLYVGAAVGSLNAVLAALFPAWASIWFVMSLPILIMSGIFYVPIELPPTIQMILFWNPVIHCVELVRASSYLNYQTFAEFYYPLLFATIVLTISVVLERLFRNVLLSVR